MTAWFELTVAAFFLREKGEVHLPEKAEAFLFFRVFGHAAGRSGHLANRPGDGRVF